MLPAVELLLADNALVPGASALLARASLDGGAERQGRALLDEAASERFALRWDVFWLILTCIWAEVACRLGHSEAARVLYERLAPWHAQFANVGPLADSAVSHY